MTLVFRIRKRYFADIVQGKKTVEYRKDSEFWRKRIQNAIKKGGIELSETNIVFPEGNEADAVFVCGKRVHRRLVTQIVRMVTPAFSEQGRKDVDTPYCWAFHLGEQFVIGVASKTRGMKHE